ncbi:hypothetical protein P59_228 [Bacillus phage P59]|nr:hypothetical protein P59_228 [Bacillus phage P59]
MQFRDDRFINLTKEQLYKELMFYENWYMSTICINTRVYIRERLNEINFLINNK